MPARTNETAVFAFMLIVPGTTLLARGMSRAQPARTTTPTTTENAAAKRASLRGAPVGRASISGADVVSVPPTALRPSTDAPPFSHAERPAC